MIYEIYSIDFRLTRQLTRWTITFYIVARFGSFRICRHLLVQVSAYIDCIDYVVQLGGFLRFQCRNENRSAFSPRISILLAKIDFCRYEKISIYYMLDKKFRDRPVFNMSDKEQNIHTPDGAHHNIYFSPGTVFFATNSSPNASLTPAGSR